MEQKAKAANNLLNPSVTSILDGSPISTIFFFQVSGCFRAVFHKKVGDAIVEEAAEEKASMVVLGTRGTSDTKRSVLGSVSNHVLHHAHCPVLVCSEGQPEDSPSIRDKVLVYF